ncbi:MAG TPA: DsbA family protein [Polyangiaceae bacterium]|nr:DsbA family protein [Polyangiaceae bacterium]
MSVPLRLYTDFVCPFCFIAEESTVPALLRDYDLTLDWRGFELHPGTPRGGMPLTALFPGAHLPSLHDRTRRFGAQFGVTGFEPPDVLVNSRRALALAELARDRNVLEPYRHAAFEAHWRKRKNLEADGDLRELATSVGLDPDEALAAADEPAYLDRVDEKQADARAQGVSGIPTFFFGDVRVVGCQPLEALARAAERAGAKRR